jgi:hypothetical protein
MLQPIPEPASLTLLGTERAELGRLKSPPHDGVKKSDTPGFEPTPFGPPSF